MTARAAVSASLAAAVLASALAFAPTASASLDDGNHQACNAANIISPSNNPYDSHTGPDAWAAWVGCILAAKDDHERTARARGQFVQDLVALLNTLSNGYANIMVFDVAGDNAFGDPWFTHPYAANLQGVIGQADVTYHDVTSREDQTYRVWAFTGGGTFTNPGDGGWVNWGFSGYYTRNGGTVTFNPAPAPVPAVPGNTSGAPLTPGAPGTMGAVTDLGGLLTGATPAVGGTTGPEGTLTPLLPPVSAGGDNVTRVAATGVTAGVTSLTGGAKFLRTAHGLGALSLKSAAGYPVSAGTLAPGGSTWLLKPVAGGRYEITNGFGLDLTENTKSYTAELQPWKNTANQKWQVLPLSNGTHQIRISDQDCLTYDEDFKTLGVWTCDNSAAQQWTIADL
ncbi:RICIN domain-containing protein [Kitasatospora sp. NPDC057015]|uniref:RICIN domain-containing protein n=1 Tax=Kitasatospora sp. NPDC057015 TaxID=3346001 RepID=UPI00363B0708